MILPGYAVPLEGFSSFLESPAFQRRLQAGAGIILLLVANTAFYWQDIRNVEDWEIGWSRPDWRAKLVTMENVTFDTNAFETNALMHPLAGTLYYLTARGSDLSAGESFAFAFAGSAVWEYLGEFREKVSLNDLVVTPVSGAAIGEPVHQLALFFERGAGPVQDVLAFALSPVRGLSRFLENRREERARRLDRLGLPADVWHRFNVLLGAGATDSGDGLRVTETRLGLHTELIQIPEYEQPGKTSRAVTDASFSRLSIDAGFDRDGLAELDLFTKVALGGYYRQNLARRGRGLSGYSLFAGTALAFEYSRHSWTKQFVDKLGVAHLPGASLDVSFHHHSLRLRTGLDVYPNFASVRSAVIDEYTNGKYVPGIKRVLADKGYYFAYGVTARPALALAYRNLELGTDVKVDLFDSIEGRDRFQGDVKKDFNLRDRRLAHRIWLSYRLPGQSPMLSWTELEQLERKGSIGIFGNVRAERRIRAGVGVVF